MKKNFKRLVSKTNYFIILFNRIDILLIFILSFLPILWFNGNNYISTADYSFWLSATKLFNNSLSSFMSDIGSGSLSPGVSAFLFPFSIGGMVFKFLDLSMVDYEKFLFVLWFLTSGLSTYYLCSVNKIYGHGRFFASLFYMMNPLSLMIYFSTQSGGMIAPAYSLAPLILAFYIKGINNFKNIMEPIFYASAWFLIGDYAYANPVLLIVQLILIFTYFLFYIYLNFKNKQKISSGIKFTFSLLIFFFILNLFWFIPYFFSVSLIIESSYLKILGFGSAYYNYTLNSLSMLNIERITGLWSMFGRSGKLLYYQWSPIYKSIFYIFLSFVPAFFAIFGIIFFNSYDKKHQKENIIFFLMLFIFIGLIVDANKTIISEILFDITKRLPLFLDIFSSNIIKFGIILCLSFSILFGYGVSKFFLIFRYKNFWFKSAISLVLFTLLVPVYMFPFFNGQIINNGNSEIHEGRFKIPSYYHKIKKKLLKTGYGNIFILPFNLNSTTTLLWGKRGGVSGYNGGDIIDENVWPYPVYFGYTGGTNLEELLLHKGFENGNHINFYKQQLPIYLGYLGIRYVIFHRDYDWNLNLKNVIDNNHLSYRKSIENKLKGMKGISFKDRAGGLYLYFLKKEYIKPIIYGSESINLIINHNSNINNIYTNLDCLNILPFFNSDTPLTQSIFINKSLIKKRYYDNLKNSNLSIDTFIFSSSNPCLLTYNQKNNDLKRKQIAKYNNDLLNYQKLNNNQYMVKVRNEKDFVVVFNKSYYTYWQAFVIPYNIIKKLKLIPAPLRELIYYLMPSFLGTEIHTHFLVNGFANGYLIPPKINKKKVNYILIEFSLQKFVVLGLIIDMIIFLFLGLYIIRYCVNLLIKSKNDLL